MSTSDKWNFAVRSAAPAALESLSATPTGAPQRTNGECPVALPEQSPLFLGTLPGDYSKISSSGRVKDFARGEMLYFEGDAVSQVFLITSGFVKITQLGSTGTEVIIRFCGPGDLLSAAALLSTECHRTTAQAFRQCRALVWDTSAFKTLVGRYPVLHQNLLKILGADLHDLEVRFREVATERVGPRVARQLVRLLGQMGRPSDNGEIEICLSREDLAQMTGTTLFTVSRLLSSWEARGLVKPRREAVAICDINLLQEMSELS